MLKKPTRRRSLLLAALLLALATTAPAQTDKLDPSQPRWGEGMRYNRATVEVLQGQIVSVDTVAIFTDTTRPLTHRRLPGRVLMTLRTNGGTVTILLGSSVFLDEQSIKLAAGDRVEVKGSRVMYQGQPYILAEYVKKGDKILRLRTEMGVPLWRTKSGD